MTLLRGPLRLFLMAMLASALPCSAQVYLGAGAFSMSFGGSDFAGMNGGVGTEARLLFGGPSTQVGADFQSSSHHVDGVAQPFRVSGAGLEARLLLVQPVTPRPFLAIRVGWVRRSVTVADSSGSIKLWQDGIILGCGPGVLLRVSSKLAFDVVAMLSFVTLGAAQTPQESFDFTEASGRVFQLRAALSLTPGRQ